MQHLASYLARCNSIGYLVGINIGTAFNTNVNKVIVVL